MFKLFIIKYKKKLMIISKTIDETRFHKSKYIEIM